MLHESYNNTYVPIIVLQQNKDMYHKNVHHLISLEVLKCMLRAKQLFWEDHKLS